VLFAAPEFNIKLWITERRYTASRPSTYNRRRTAANPGQIERIHDFVSQGRK